MFIFNGHDAVWQRVRKLQMRLSAVYKMGKGFCLLSSFSAVFQFMVYITFIFVITILTAWFLLAFLCFNLCFVKAQWQQ